MHFFYISLSVFIIGGVFGWILEILYRSSKDGKFVNPGFLAGPCLPIYGLGGIGLFWLCELDLSFLPSLFLENLFRLFLIMLVMTLIELFTGLIFDKMFHIRLWDYSKMKWNLNGYICPVFSFFWMVIGEIYYFLFHPLLQKLFETRSPSTNEIFLLGICYGILILDVLSSFEVATRIRTWAKESKISVHYQEIRKAIQEKAKLSRKRTKPFSSETRSPFQIAFENYIEKHYPNLYQAHLKAKKKKEKVPGNEETLKEEINAEE